MGIFLRRTFVLGVVLGALAALSASALARPQRVEIGIREYRFDDARISAEALAPLLALAEDGEILASTVSGDPLDEIWLKRRDLSFDRWAVWGPPLLARGRARQAELERAIAHLRDLEPPTLLLPVKAYVLASLTFSRDKEAIGLDLVERWDLSALRRRVGTVDPAATCGEAIAKVEQLADKMARFNAFMFDWGNCVNRGRPDGYPSKAWRKFLKKYRIREIFHEEANAD